VRIITSPARIRVADNRSELYVGVLNAYREDSKEGE
jgi:hypothetical protein